MPKPWNQAATLSLDEAYSACQSGKAVRCVQDSLGNGQYVGWEFRHAPRTADHTTECREPGGEWVGTNFGTYGDRASGMRFEELP
jgi:hypothetical protein